MSRWHSAAPPAPDTDAAPAQSTTTTAPASTPLRIIGADALLLPATAPAWMPQAFSSLPADRWALFAPATVFLNAAAMQALGVSSQPTQTPLLLLQTGLQRVRVRVAGSIAAPGAPLAVMDIGAAQDLFGRAGQLTRIDLQWQPGSVPEAVQQALQATPGWPALHAELARLADLGVLPDMMAGNISGVIGQRLVRVLCVQCKTASTPDDVEQRLLFLPNSPPPEMIFRPVGCPQCRGTGYRGRRTVMEVLRFDEEFDALVGSRAPLSAFRALVAQREVMPLADAAVALVRAGETALEEVLRVVDLTGRLAR